MRGLPGWGCMMLSSLYLAPTDPQIKPALGDIHRVVLGHGHRGADVLTTGCPACMIQISDMLSQAGADVAVRHPVELYAEALEK